MKASCLVVVVLSACAGLAHAQSSVSVYGVLEADGVIEGACSDCAPQHDGLSVLKPYSFRYLSLLGVGEAFDGVAEAPFALGAKREGKRITGSVQYYTRENDGGSSVARYGIIDSRGNASGNRAWGVSLGLERSGVMMRIAHQNKNVAKIVPAMSFGNNMSAKNSVIAANIKLGAAKVYAAYSASRGWGSSPLWNPDNPYGASLSATPSTDSRDKLIGIALPMGETTFLASFIRKNDRDLANYDADQFALGATYAVSRRTDFYTTCSVTKIRSIAGQAIHSSVMPGSKNAAINVGMRHAF
ncbi:porin [Massilia sp. RP-1-19]|uniref:Porin n=1 Tax=Massilia polaris TaxID=2728846 RepID=A0A848HSN5_9BURK|nr:porin [Massilia polaris]NML61678.1 porin [Massilia polaris]